MAKHIVREAQNPFANRIEQNNAQAATMALLGGEEHFATAFPGAEIDEEGVVVIGNYRLTPVGLIDSGATIEEWEKIGRYFKSLTSSLTWLIADWMNSGERIHGVTYEIAAELVGRKVKTLYNWSYVAGQVDISRRREILQFTHHAMVAALHSEDQDYWLEQAAAFGLTSRKLEALINQHPNGLPEGFMPNQIKPRLKDPADKLQEEFVTFKQRIAKIEKKAGKTSRKLLAQWMRDEADRLDGTAGEG